MMRRRDFLRATLLTAGSVVAPAACSDDDAVGGACSVEGGATFFPQSVASGDPRPDSVVLWTRIDDPSATGDLTLTLAVARDEAFADLVAIEGSTRVLLTAEEAFDRCVKVKVTGLEPGTTYYYRFYYTSADTCFASQLGRTRTAPAEDADVAVKFAFVSCQDYIGRYYNSYVALAQEEIDFFVHLGDYVYETTGDPSFQSLAEDRSVTFTDVDGAIAFSGAGGETSYYAARSLSNYRELYKTYRSDRALQRMHELFPMIAVWDDHEFSDDCHGATACYFNGEKNETDEDRRKAANQAWFEYMPVDYPADDAFRYDPAAKYPDDIRIYRDFTFGKHVHLVMTDLRTHRADHLIPEDAFPGEVIATQDELAAVFGEPPSFATPYLPIDTFQEGFYKDVLVGAAAALKYDPAKVTGLVNAAFVNTIVAKLNETTVPPVPSIDAPELSVLDRGFAYVDLGKNGFHASIGSRYLVVKDVFDPVSQFKYQATSGASGVIMGPEQQAWFLDTMKKSTATWKVWGNEFCLVPLAIDLRPQTILPEAFRRRFYMNCDGWDGFREQRSALLEELADVGNVVAITGDIHAFFAGTPTSDADQTKKIVEFVGSGVSSGTYKSLLLSQVKSDATLSALPGASLLAGMIDSFLTSKDTRINPHLAFANSAVNGFCVAEASAEEFVVTMHHVPEADIAGEDARDHFETPDELKSKITTTRFKTLAGASDLYREDDDTWKRWDMATMEWV